MALLLTLVALASPENSAGKQWSIFQRNMQCAADSKRFRLRACGRR